MTRMLGDLVSLVEGDGRDVKINNPITTPTDTEIQLGQYIDAENSYFPTVSGETDRVHHPISPQSQQANNPHRIYELSNSIRSPTSSFNASEVYSSTNNTATTSEDDNYNHRLHNHLHNPHTFNSSQDLNHQTVGHHSLNRFDTPFHQREVGDLQTSYEEVASGVDELFLSADVNPDKNFINYPRSIATSSSSSTVSFSTSTVSSSSSTSSIVCTQLQDPSYLGDYQSFLDHESSGKNKIPGTSNSAVSSINSLESDTYSWSSKSPRNSPQSVEEPHLRERAIDCLAFDRRSDSPPIWNSTRQVDRIYDYEEEEKAREQEQEEMNCNLETNIEEDSLPACLDTLGTGVDVGRDLLRCIVDDGRVSGASVPSDPDRYAAGLHPYASSIDFGRLPPGSRTDAPDNGSRDIHMDSSVDTQRNHLYRADHGSQNGRTDTVSGGDIGGGCYDQQLDELRYGFTDEPSAGDHGEHYEFPSVNHSSTQPSSSVPTLRLPQPRQHRHHPVPRIHPTSSSSASSISSISQQRPSLHHVTNTAVRTGSLSPASEGFISDNEYQEGEDANSQDGSHRQPSMDDLVSTCLHT